MVKKKNKTRKVRKAKQGKGRLARPMPTLAVMAAPVSNVAIQGGKRRMPVGAISPGGCIVQNFEQLTAYTAANGAFQCSTLYINAGVINTFPWLSGVAANYQKFRFRHLRFFFSTTVPTSEPGKAFINLQYDPLDTTPTTLAQVEASQDSSSGPVWFGGAVNGEKGFDMSINADYNVFVDYDISKATHNWFWTRANNTDLVYPNQALGGVIPGGLTLSTVKNFDDDAFAGSVNYGTQGGTNAKVPGYLYAAYICELTEPIAPALNL